MFKPSVSTGRVPGSGARLSFALLGRSSWATMAVVGALGLTGCGGGSADDSSQTAQAASDTTVNATDANAVSLDTQLESALTALQGKASWTMPDSGDYAAIPQDEKNPITAAKVQLGQMLYHDPATGSAGKQASLSVGTYSCASCHHAAFGFQSGLRQGLGEGGQGMLHRMVRAGFPTASLDVQPVRTPSDMNAAWQRNMLWNGQFGAQGVNVGTESQWTPGTPKAVNAKGYEGVEVQAIAGQGVHRIGAAPEIYRGMFDAAFPSVDAGVRYDAEHAGLAIAAFERTLISNQAPWQLWLKGSTAAMTDAQKRGALLFLGKANCAACHSGPTLNLTPDNVSSRLPSFFALGFKDMGDPSASGALSAADIASANKGRGGFTGVEADNHKFKVPQLYNLADSPFYGHGGSMTDLRAVVEYLNAGVKENAAVPDGQLAAEFKPLGLSTTEIDDLTEFLKTGLRDPNLLRYQPKSVLSGKCVVSDDPVANVEMGCPITP